MKQELNQFDEEGKEHGPWKVYFDNGFLEFEGTYHHGLRDGLCIDYFHWGTPLQKANYKKGVMHGFSTAYTGNGSVSSIYSYAEGQVDGHCRSFWGFNDCLQQDFFAKNGEYLSPVRNYDVYGKLELEIINII